jgi:gliding motility-associated-like protein
MTFRFLSLLIAGLFLGNVTAQVVINEFSCSNKDAYLDNFGEYEDWIELYNSGATTVDISGYFLTDKRGNRGKWAFPSGTNINAGAHLRVFASSLDQNTAPLHTNFKITQMKQEYIILSSALDTSLVDSIRIDVPVQKNHSYGRATDGANTWKIFTNPSPNSSNNNVTAYDGYALRPIFGPSPGFYTAAVSLSMNTATAGLSIRYTIDGSEPNGSSLLYNGPINISNTSLIRAKCFSTNPLILPSFTESNTYFINENHQFPVLSVGSKDFNDLFDEVSDEIVSSFEYYDANKQFQFELEGDFKGHGNDSWAFDQKGIRFYARDQYGYANKIDYPIFPTSNRTDFDVLIIRNSGSDNYPGGSIVYGRPTCHLRDGYIQSLADKHQLNVDTRKYQPCIVYLNGQYWGIYEMRERIDADYTDYYYGQEEKWLDMLEYWGGLDVRYGDPLANDWNNLYNYMNNNNLANSAAYNTVLNEIDEMSFLDYFIVNTHIVNTDWLNWNTKWWRGIDPPDPTGWRYTFWDMDNVFNLGQNYTGVDNTTYLNDPCDPQSLFTNDPDVPHMDMFNALLDNPTFYDLYINRYADLLNTTLNCDTMLSHFDAMLAEITPEMPRQIARWGGTMNDWNYNVQLLRAEISGRCAVIDSLLIGCYQPTIGPKKDIAVQVSPANAGQVKVNTIFPAAYPWQGSYFSNVNLSFQAYANPGYVFDHWELFNHSASPSITSDSIFFSLNTADSVVAVFQLALSVSSNVVDDTCTLGVGAINLSIAGGGGPFSFYWSTNDTTQDINGLSAGSYSVTVSDSQLNSLVQNFVITDNPGPQITVQSDNDNCYAAAIGQIDITINGGNAPFSYLWSDGTTTEDRLALLAGGYSLTVTDGSNCTLTESINLAQDSFPVLSAVIQPITCFGAADGAVNTSVTGGQAPYSYSWSSSLGSNASINNLQEGLYYLTVTDIFSCTVSYMASLTNPLALEATFETNYAQNDNDGSLEAVLNGGTMPYNYQWNDPNSQTTAVAAGLAPGLYQLTVIDSLGCQRTFEVDLPLGDFKCIQSVMTFTPNGDAVNDTWELPCLASMPHQVRVFNRWGQLLFQSNNYDNSWDGTQNGQPLPDGGYFYTIEVTDQNNKTYPLQGALNIVR